MNEPRTGPDWTREPLAQGKCAIGRFWGQTQIYVPAPLCERLDDDTIYRLIEEVFTKERFGVDRRGSIYRGKDFCAFETPTSFSSDYENQQENPWYHKPDELVARIMALGPNKT